MLWLTLVAGGLVFFAARPRAQGDELLGSLPDGSARWRRLRLQVEGRAR
jgi:hypothetical protein